VLASGAAALWPHYEVNGTPIRFRDNGVALRTWLSLAPRGNEWLIYEKGAAPNAHDTPPYNLVICMRFTDNGDSITPELLRNATRRLRRAFDDNARITRNVTCIFIRSGRDLLYLIASGLQVGEYRSTHTLARWLTTNLDGSLAPLEDLYQPTYAHCQRMPLANSGDVTFVGALGLDSCEPTGLSAQETLAQHAGLHNWAIRPGSNYPEVDCFSARQSWRREFREFVNRGVRARSAEQLADINACRDDYRRRIYDSRRNRIDLAREDAYFNPSDPRCHELIVEAIGKDEGAFVFSDAREWLDRIFAYNPVKDILYYKTTDNFGRFTVAEAQNAKASMKRFGLRYTLKYPENETLRRVMREEMTGEKAKNPPEEFDFFEWYLVHGADRVDGVAFKPLNWEQSNAQALGNKINTFRGFAAHANLTGPRTLDILDRGLDLDTLRRDNGRASDLGFLLKHICYLMGESDREFEQLLADDVNRGLLTTTTGAFLGWLCNMIFTPAKKLPRFYVLQGPPGCGKSSFIKAIAEKLLHPAHVRIYTDVAKLVQEFNGHAAENVLTVLEEVNMADLNSSGLRQLQELVSGTERYERKLYKEGDMVPDYRRFFVATNVMWPIPLPPGQRRCVLARFNHEMAQRLEIKEFREVYLARLDRVLNNSAVMTQFAHFLLKEYNTGARSELLERTIHTARRFNFETLETQLAHLKNDQNTSVLGWLYQYLVNLDDFFGDDAARHYVYPSLTVREEMQQQQEPASKRRRDHLRATDFTAWPCLVDLVMEKNPVTGALETCTAPNEFTGRWRDSTDDPKATYAQKCAQRRSHSRGYWTRGRKAEFYASYKAVIPERAQLNLQEFTDSCRHILGSTYHHADSSNSQPIYLLESTERKDGRSHDVWCVADLESLEAAFRNAVPNAHELDWDSYRFDRERSKQRMQL
jgi:hypothetical protein